MLYLYIILHINKEFPEIKTEILMKKMSSNRVHITLIRLNSPFNSKDGLVVPVWREEGVFLHQ